MGTQELLILILLLAIVAVVLRGMYVVLSRKRGQLKIQLEKNIPEYNLEELELRELPNGGARQVERSFAEVMKRNSMYETSSARSSILDRRSAAAKGLKTDLTRGRYQRTQAAAATPGEPAATQHDNNTHVQPALAAATAGLSADAISTEAAKTTAPILSSEGMATGVANTAPAPQTNFKSAAQPSDISAEIDLFEEFGDAHGKGDDSEYVPGERYGLNGAAGPAQTADQTGDQL